MHPKTPATIYCLLLLLAVTVPLTAEPLTVEIKAPDGIDLVATHTSPGKPGPAVLLLHMCNSDRSAWTGLATKLAAGGIHSLALDYRGYGDSGGEQSREERQKWAGDVDAALAYLSSRPDVDSSRIGAAGGSCGVNQAVQVARRHPEQVKTLALLAGTTDAEGEGYLAENPWLPILAVASRDDGQAVESLRWTLGFSGGSDNQFLEYEEGGHGTELFAVHGDLEPAIESWFVKHLLDQPVERPENVVAKPGPSVRLWEELTSADGLAKAMARIRAAKAAGEAVSLPPQAALNVEGYRLIGAGDTKRAIEVLGLVVEAFPSSANALDSLGDAYLAAGQPEKAAELARRTLAAIPDDPSLGEDFSRQLREAAEGKLGGALPEGDQ